LDKNRTIPVAFPDWGGGGGPPRAHVAKGGAKKAKEKKKTEKRTNKKIKIKNEEKTMFTPLLHQTHM
jgi:hypothetical protein